MRAASPRARAPASGRAVDVSASPFFFWAPLKRLGSTLGRRRLLRGKPSLLGVHREGLRNPQGTRVSVRERLHARRVFPIHYLRVRTHATRRPAHECGVALALRAERTCVLCWAQVRFHKTQVRFSRAQMRCAQSANALPRERKCVSNRPHLRATFGVICGARHLACPRHLVCRTFLHRERRAQDPEREIFLHIVGRSKFLCLRWLLCCCSDWRCR